MTTTTRRTAARFWALVSGLGATLMLSVQPPSAQAASMTGAYSYSTVGTVSDQGRTGPAVIGINSETQTDISGPGQIRLGAFQVRRLSGNRSTTYADTPFQFSIYNGEDADPIVLKGSLNGTISGEGESGVVARFESPSIFTQTMNDVTTTIHVNQSDYNLDATSSSVAANAQVEFGTLALPAPVPEPTSAAILLAAIAGWRLRRRFRSHKS